MELIHTESNPRRIQPQPQEAIKMPNTKEIQYSKDTDAIMMQVYNPEASQGERDAQVSELADKFGKKEKSIIAKLSKLGVYVKKQRVSKVTGDKPKSKADMVKDISTVLNVSFDKVESLTNATKTALVEIFEAIKPSEENETANS